MAANGQTPPSFCFFWIVPYCSSFNSQQILLNLFSQIWEYLCMFEQQLPHPLYIICCKKTHRTFELMHKLCPHLRLAGVAGVAVHVSQVAFHLQELRWRRLLRGRWCLKAGGWRRRRGGLWGRRGWIGWWWWGLGGGIRRYHVLLGHFRSYVWV